MFSDEEDEFNESGSVSSESYDKKLEELWVKKQRRRSSEFKQFEGDKLNMLESSKMASLLIKNSEKYIIFSDIVIKINKKGRTQERCLVITDGGVYNIDPTSGKVRRRISLANISHVSTSLFYDNFFLIHVPSEYDYLFVSGRKTEIVSVLRHAYTGAMGEELNLVLQNVIDYRIDKDQRRRLVFQQGGEGVFTKIYAAKKTK